MTVLYYQLFGNFLVTLTMIAWYHFCILKIVILFDLIAPWKYRNVTNS